MGNRRLSSENVSEHDSINVFGKVRHKSGKAIETCEISLVAMHVPRAQLNEDAVSIGAAWKKEKNCLFARVDIPVDALHSLATGFAVNTFKQIHLRLRDFKRGGGLVFHMGIDEVLSDPADMGWK
jgi:hypothetical protein